MVCVCVAWDICGVLRGETGGAGVRDLMSVSEPTCLHDWRAANWIMIVAIATVSTVGANHDIRSGFYETYDKTAGICLDRYLRYIR